MTRNGPGSYLLAVLGVAMVSALTAFWLPTLGLASSALLFLLPVLLVSARGGLGPGLIAAVGGALAYNYFLLPPRFTLRVHGLDNVVSVVVLVAVALVTSRQATALRARQAEADARAEASAETAALAALLGKGAANEVIDRGLEWLSERFGAVELIPQDPPPGDGGPFSTLDLSAAAWSAHNGDVTGHGTAIMPAADWSFLPLSPPRQGPCDLLAVARAPEGTTRTGAELAQLQALARLLGQARDRYALEEERRARERLEDRDLLRRTLLASVAHDFRTPLTVIAGELERLSPSDMGAANALAEARRLDRMMADLIGAARIEGGALAPRLEAVDLIDIVADARLALGSGAGALDVEQDLPGDLPLVEADPVLLRHVLINLLDNAARHATARIAIRARVAPDAVELLVDDDGKGIPPEERTRIFERFERIEGGDRRGGSGLGLAIVRGFADAMGMTVTIDDGPDGGARFRLAMPRHVTPAA